MSKVYDCCCFLNENDIYEIRINQHWDHVDKFIVLEAEETHTGDKKPLRFDKQRFEKYSSKLVYETIPSFDWLLEEHPDLTNNFILRDRSSSLQASKDWTRDHVQFDYLVKLALRHEAKDEDVLVFSPLDEIISDSGFKSGLSLIRSDSPQDGAHSWYQSSTSMNLGSSFSNTGVEMDTKPFFYFSMRYYAKKVNLYHSTQNCGGMFPVATAKKVSPATLRSLSICTHPPIPNGGWHFCTMDDGTGEMALQKYKSWAHSRDRAGRDWTYYETLSPEEAKKRLELDWPCSKVELNYKNHPAYLVENQEKFKHLIA